MKRYTAAPLFRATARLSAAAVAAPICTSAPKDQRTPDATIKRKILRQGYTTKVFKVAGTCYEPYGKDKVGKNVATYFSPTDGTPSSSADGENHRQYKRQSLGPAGTRVVTLGAGDRVSHQLHRRSR